MTALDPNVDWGFVEGLINNIRSIYPNLAWMLDEPALRDVIIKAGLEQWDDGRVLAALQSTDWWKSRNDNARAWEELIHTNPGEADSTKRALANTMLQWAGQNGIKVTMDEALFSAGVSLSKGKSQAEWQSDFVAEFVERRGQTVPTVANTLKTLSAEYAVPMSDATLNEWTKQILAGTADEATFRAYLAEQAKSLFPGLSNAIDRGITVRQYVAPYQEIAAQELGINPASIDWRDPKWSPAIHAIDPKSGNPISMSLSEWTRKLRSDPIYGFDQTPRAQEQATMLARSLAERLGFAA